MLLNKIKTSLLIGITTVILTGCGYTPLPEQHFQHKEVRVDKHSDGTIGFFAIYTAKGFHKNTSDIISEIKEAGYYGKAKGFKYFAIKSDNFNNILGMPITTINDILKYCSYPTASAAQDNSGDCGGLSYRTDVLFFKENPNEFPVWNVDDVINEKIDLTTIHSNEDKQKLIDYLTSKKIPFKN